MLALTPFHLIKLQSLPLVLSRQRTMASKLLITLTIVLVLTREHALPTVGLKTYADPKDAGTQQGVMQGETFAAVLERICLTFF